MLHFTRKSSRLSSLLVAADFSFSSFSFASKSKLDIPFSRGSGYIHTDRHTQGRWTRGVRGVHGRPWCRTVNGVGLLMVMKKGKNREEIEEKQEIIQSEETVFDQKRLNN